MSSGPGADPAPDIHPDPPDPAPVSGPVSPVSVAPSGRLHAEGLSESDRNYVVWLHVSAVLAFFVLGPGAVAAPLVMWLLRRERSAFVDDHGREVVNMTLTGAILFVVGVVTLIGLVAWSVWAIVVLVNIVRGSIAASNGEYFRYPVTIRFLS
ncbi:MAG: DUF4870 domain-containing protein [Planctomycetota bacterium]|jgi:uncharacterized Tic20 family protein